MKRISLLIILAFAISFPVHSFAQYSVTVNGKRANVYTVNGYHATMPVMIPVSVKTPSVDLTVAKRGQGTFSFTARNNLNGWTVNDFILGQPGSPAGIAFDFSVSKAYYLPQDMIAQIMQTMTGDDKLIITGISGAAEAPSDMQLVLVDASMLRRDQLDRFPPMVPRDAANARALMTRPTKPPFLNNMNTYSTGVIVNNRPVITAAANGQTDLVKTLITNGGDLNETDPSNGYNALMAAIKMGDERMALDLVDMGINTRYTNRYGQNALHLAGEMGLFDLGQRLLAAGLKPNDRDNGGNTPLMYSAASPNASLVELLIRRGAGINDANNDNAAALAFAAYYGNTRSVDVLIDKGADVNAKDNNSETVLIRAVRSNNQNITDKLLKNGANINAQDKSGNTALHIAAEQNNTTLASLLINSNANLNIQNQAGQTPLMLAVEAGNTPLVKIMLAHTPDLFIADANGNTPYMLAGSNSQISSLMVQSIRDADEMVINLFDRVAANDAAGVESLLRGGSRVNVADVETGNTPIFVAVANNFKEMLALLIRNGADVNWQNKSGNTPLIVAVSTGDERMVDMLISAKANVNTRNNNGDTALMWAVKLQRFEIVRIFIINSADPNLRNFDGISPLAVAEGEAMTDIARILRSAGAF